MMDEPNKLNSAEQFLFAVEYAIASQPNNSLTEKSTYAVAGFLLERHNISSSSINEAVDIFCRASGKDIGRSVTENIKSAVHQHISVFGKLSI